jgi:hypothetical protein
VDRQPLLAEGHLLPMDRHFLLGADRRFHLATDSFLLPAEIYRQTIHSDSVSVPRRCHSLQGGPDLGAGPIRGVVQGVLVALQHEIAAEVDHPALEVLQRGPAAEVQALQADGEVWRTKLGVKVGRAV